MTKSLTTILQVGIQVLFLAGILSTAAHGNCGVSEYEVYDPRNSNGPVTCHKCPICPPGKGLPNQCGGRIPNGTSRECKPCEARKMYSDTNDTSSCKPCHECHKNTVQQECTRTQNRKCGDCLPKHFWNPILDTCEECFFCCDHVPESGHREECKGLGLPWNERCEANDENKMCKHRASQNNKTITSSPTVTVMPLTRWNSTINASAVIPGDLINSTNAEIVNSAVKAYETIIPAIIIGTCVLLALVVISFGMYILYQRHFQVNQGQSDSMHRNQEYTSVERGDLSEQEMTQLQNGLADSILRGRGRKFQPSNNPSTDISTASSSESVLIGRNEVSSNTPPTTRQENPLTPLVSDLDIQRIPENLVITDMWSLRSTDDVDCMIFHVEKKLDVPETPQKKAWRSVALSLGVAPDVLDRIRMPEATEPLLQHFKASGGEQPTMRKFVRALIICERKDLASIICKWPYHPEVNTHPRTH